MEVGDRYYHVKNNNIVIIRNIGRTVVTFLYDDSRVVTCLSKDFFLKKFIKVKEL
jgi:hypothetical protein